MSTAPKPASPEFEKAVRDSFAKQGLMGTIGAWLVEVSPGRVVIELPYSWRVAQSEGVFQSAIAGALAETAAGHAAMGLMPAGGEVQTVEYKINFTAPAKGGLLRAEGQVVQSSRSLSTVHVDIECVDNDKSTACAVMQATIRHVAKTGR